MAFYDTLNGRARLGLGGLYDDEQQQWPPGVGGFPSIGVSSGQPQQSQFGQAGNTNEAWSNGVSRVDRFANEFGMSRGRAYGMMFGRIDARAPQAQVRTGLQTPTMTGQNSLTDTAAWNGQFQQRLPVAAATSPRSWEQPGIKVSNDQYQRMRRGGFNSTLPDPYA